MKLPVMVKNNLHPDEQHTISKTTHPPAKPTLGSGEDTPT